MPEKKFHILGQDDIVLLFGLVGIEGTILDNTSDFVKEFEKLTNNPTIGMLIVAMQLPRDQLDYIFDFKLNNRFPFIFYLPDLFQPNIDKEDPFLNKVKDSIGKILT